MAPRPLFDELDLRDLTYVGQDWGALIGLRLVAGTPDRYARVVLSNGGVPTGEQRVADAFRAWLEFSQTAEEFPIGGIVSGGLHHPAYARGDRRVRRPVPRGALQGGGPPDAQPGADHPGQ